MKQRFRCLALSFILAANTILTSGCWNYRDIDKLSLVSGLAIDWDEANHQYILTVEAIEFKKQGSETASSPEIFETKGLTIFDAVRNVIEVSPRRL